MLKEYPVKNGKPENVFDVMYVHSPVTYSVGRHLRDHGYLKNELVVICGRSQTWDTPCVTVPDDGVWEVDRVCLYLTRLAEALPDDAAIRINLYVPHSAFILGKLFRISGIVDNLYYLEEGDASYSVDFCDNPRFNEQIDAARLIAVLEQHGLIEKLQLDRTALQNINEMPTYFYDRAHPKYKGAYALSEGAFPGFKNVTYLTLDSIPIIPEGEKIWLCMLPSFVHLMALHREKTQLVDKMFYGLLMMLRTQNALVQDMGGSLILKMHPLDESHLNQAVKQEILRYGTEYRAFFEMNEFEIGHEPALYNFSKFIVIGGSSAIRYVKLLRGNEHLINIKLD
jgi:hypothetical protein